MCIYVLFLYLDDVSYKIWSCGIFTFRADGRNGGSAARKGEAQETDKRREIRRWTIKKHPYEDSLKYFDLLSHCLNLMRLVIAMMLSNEEWIIRSDSIHMSRKMILYHE